MVGGSCQHVEGKSIAEKYTTVEAIEREVDKMAGKADCQARGGYSSLDQECEDLRVSSQPSLDSECSTLVPRPPPKRRPAGGKNFRLRFQSAPLLETVTETTTEQDGCAPNGCAPDGCPPKKTKTESAVRPRRPSGAAGEKVKNFRQKFESAPLPETCIDIATQRDGRALDGCAPKTGTDSAMPPCRPSGRAPSRLRAKILNVQVQQHRSETLDNFDPIEDISEEGEEEEPMSRLSDTDGEESS
eukprot:TRINITY_DN16644_c0_g6_i2.p1 TRINITY_DN16644_c0_g6~~TRINITY_DN16644_c0_g6_i2.p1  ORF type:complete len:244 (+),score=38.99 TRINITY_DN16644_c0_g6_i2:91-822(+)